MDGGPDRGAGVWAVVLGAPVPGVAEVLDAVGRQTASPDGVVAVCRAEDAQLASARGATIAPLARGARTAAAFDAGGRAALARAPTWLWLLDGTATPRPDALERLLDWARADGPLPLPVLLASRVTLPDGGLDEGAAPWPTVSNVELAIDAYEHGCVSIRTARHGSLLVAREAIERHGLPRLDYAAAGDDVEWTARLLRRDKGLYVPASEVVRDATARDSGWLGDGRLELRNRAAMLVRGPLEARERLWLGLELGDRALGHARDGAALRVLGALAEGVARGLRGEPSQPVPKAAGDEGQRT